jgi:uncharacterized membrane protein
LICPSSFHVDFSDSLLLKLLHSNKERFIRVRERNESIRRRKMWSETPIVIMLLQRKSPHSGCFFLFVSFYHSLLCIFFTQVIFLVQAGKKQRTKTSPRQKERKKTLFEFGMNTCVVLTISFLLLLFLPSFLNFRNGEGNV